MSSQSEAGYGFNFHDLFVLDMANNHQGDVEHGLKIVHGMGAAAKAQGGRAGVKFQFRQLNSFIHPSHHEASDNKHIPRFLSTRLSREDYETLLNAVCDEGLISICTPFDEESVDVITDMGFDVIKVASCSAKDWPLLQKVADAALPVIFSTGGLDISDIDNLVSFFEHRGVDFAIMHCVSIYPIPDEHFQLNQIDLLRKRYPDHVVGWSTHEDPDALAPVQMAVAKGAKMFERHVGVTTDKISLNAYSSTPDQIGAWIAAQKLAVTLCGTTERCPSPTVEIDSIDSLRRGVYAKTSIKKGQKIGRDQVYFAMPYVEGQLESGNWKEGLEALSTFKRDTPLLDKAIERPSDPEFLVIKQTVHNVKALLNEAHVVLNSEFEVEYSHHYGLENFEKTGAVIINCINREYCKKIIVQLPGQHHPAHYHHRKEETFQVLHGIVQLSVDGHIRQLGPGETCLVQPGVWHSFWTDTGCIIEEISTTHYPNDSFYKDKNINMMKREDRKTIVDHWGRFQLSEETQSAR